MNALGKYLLYFLLGGSIVSFSTYSWVAGQVVPRRHGQHVSRHHWRHPHLALCRRRWGNDGRLRQELAVVRPSLDRLRRRYDLGHSAPWLLAGDGWITRPIYGMCWVGEDGIAIDRSFLLYSTTTAVPLAFTINMLLLVPIVS